MNPERFEILLAALLDGSISAEDQRELLNAASANPQLGHRILELLRMEAVLADSVRNDAAGQGFLRRVQQRVEKAGDSARFAKAVIDAVKKEAARRNAISGRAPAVSASGSGAMRAVSASGSGLRPMVNGDSTRQLRPIRSSRGKMIRLQKQSPVGAIVTAAVLALLVTGLILSQHTGEPAKPKSGMTPIAFLRQFKGEVELIQGSEKIAAANGTSVQAGQGIETAANAEATLVYGDGTSVVIQPQSVIAEIRDGALDPKSTDGKQITLKRGEISASVSKQPAGRPLVVRTETARVLVVGTRFSLSSKATSTRLEVSEGAVELTRNSDAKTVMVSAGQFVVAANDGDLNVQSLTATAPITPRVGIQERIILGEPFAFTAASYLGGKGNDSVVGSEIQSNGTVILAAHISNARPDGRTPIMLNGADAETSGAIVRLTATGRIVLSVTRIAESVNDLALDANDNIYVAAGKSGVLKLDAQARKTLWKAQARGSCLRLDAAKDGTIVALLKEDSGAERISLLDANGKLISEMPAPFETRDIAIDSKTKSIFAIGKSGTNARLSAFRYDGAPAWQDYSTENPARECSTEGHRVSIGRDGKLYAAFSTNRANNIFEFNPQRATQPASLIAKDDYARLSNLQNAHATFFGRFDPGNGELLAGQFLLGRNAKGYGSSISMEHGEIKADENGRVYLSGEAEAGAPFTADAVGIRNYASAQGFVMICAPDFSKRELFTTLNINSDGASAMHTISARNIPGQNSTTLICGGKFNALGSAWTREAVQRATTFGDEGFFAVRGVGQAKNGE